MCIMWLWFYSSYLIDLTHLLFPLLICGLLNRFMEKMNGPLGSVNMVLACLAVLQQRIQCIHTAKLLNLEKHHSLSTRSIRSLENSVESGLDSHMICYQRTAITSAMSFVKDLACKSFLVSSWHLHLFSFPWKFCMGALTILFFFFGFNIEVCSHMFIIIAFCSPDVSLDYWQV